LVEGESGEDLNGGGGRCGEGVGTQRGPCGWWGIDGWGGGRCGVEVNVKEEWARGVDPAAVREAVGEASAVDLTEIGGAGMEAIKEWARGWRGNDSSQC
jgi:hypothetical protein